MKALYNILRVSFVNPNLSSFPSVLHCINMSENNYCVGTEKDALEDIKRWLRDEKLDLHARSEDKYLLHFLRGCNFDLEKTKTKITNYYTMRRDECVWFRNRDPLLDEIQDLLELGVFVPLRKLHKKHLVVIIRTAAHDPKKHTQDNVFKTGQMLLDVAALLEYKLSTIDGIIAVFDMKNVTIWHAKELTPSVIKRAVFSWVNYYYTPNHLEFISAPFYVDVVLNIFRSFMPEEMKQCMRVHRSLDGFYKVVDQSVLPVEYGGNGDSLNELIHYWKEKVLSYRDWFLEDEQYRAE